MKVSMVTKVRAGFTLAIFIILFILESESVQGIDIRQRNGMIICGSLGLAGLLIWATGGLGRSRTAAADGQAASTGEVDPEDPLASFKSRRYWGFLMLLSALVLAAASLYHRQPQPKPVPVVAKPVPVVVAPPITNEPEPAPKPAVTFPPLKLESLVVNGARSSAQINGRVLFVGESIQGVRLVAVDATHATLELEGQTNILTLGQ